MATHLFQVARTAAVPPTAVVLDPVLFEGPDGSFRIHKGKLAYLVAAAEEFCRGDRLRVVYPDDADAFYAKVAASADRVLVYDPLDRFIERRLRSVFGSALVLEPNPGFVLDPTAYGGALRLAPVYKAARAATGIMVGTTSQDAANRAPPDEALLSFDAEPRRRRGRVLDDAVKYVERRFPDHVGDARAARLYPMSAASAAAAARRYTRTGLPMMRYQDAMARGRPFLAHSRLSAALNVGLLCPVYLCRLVAASPATLSDREGFVRQILGWRELMHILYHKRRAPLEAAFSAFPSPGAAWYTGRTGLDPLDDVITGALRTAYSHHISRLMVALNALVLCEKPAGAAYRWFMEVVAIDAYDWVMVGNLAVMGYQTAAPGVAHKPYISSSSYIVRMSSGFESTAWRRRWDALFYAYVYKHRPRMLTAAVLRGRRFTADMDAWLREGAAVRDSL